MMVHRKDGTTEGWDKLCFGHDDFYEAIECQETFLKAMQEKHMDEVRREQKIFTRLVKRSATTFEVMELPQMVSEE